MAGDKEGTCGSVPFQLSSQKQERPETEDFRERGERYMTLKDELQVQFSSVQVHWKVPNMLLEISGEITPERMKIWTQSKSNTQLWM